MALFLVVATPVFVFGAVLYLADRGTDPPWPWLLRSFGAAMVFGFPAYAGTASILGAFADSYRELHLYIRALLGEHLLPAAGAIGAALLLQWWRPIRRADVGSRGAFPPRSTVLAVLGGFLTTFAILERLDHLSDPSAYWLLLLPLLRLGVIGLLAALVSAAETWNGWTRAGIIALAAGVPLVAASVPMLAELSQYLFATVVAVLLFLGGIAALYLVRQAEPHHT